MSKTKEELLLDEKYAELQNKLQVLFDDKTIKVTNYISSKNFYVLSVPNNKKSLPELFKAYGLLPHPSLAGSIANQTLNLPEPIDYYAFTDSPNYYLTIVILDNNYSLDQLREYLSATLDKIIEIKNSNKLDEYLAKIEETNLEILEKTELESNLEKCLDEVTKQLEKIKAPLDNIKTLTLSMFNTVSASKIKDKTWLQKIEKDYWHNLMALRKQIEVETTEALDPYIGPSGDRIFSADRASTPGTTPTNANDIEKK